MVALLLGAGVAAPGHVGPFGAGSSAEPSGVADADVEDLEADDERFATAGEDVAPVTVDDPLRGSQWYLDRIRAPGAWSTTRGDPSVTVAVIDTGVDPEHPDLAGAFTDELPGGTHGYDHLRRTSSTYVGPMQDWHGTAVAGIVASRADDGFGIAGVAPDVRLMVHRIYESTSTNAPPADTSYSLAAEAIREATTNGADVILLTWGGKTPSSALAAAIRDAGVPVVAAAGNDGQDLSGSPSVRRYPAMYRMPNLVTVAASDRDSGILRTSQWGSNFGARHVDLAAPGEEILSLWPGGAHEVFEGTSFAAPQVAAALALGRSLAPGTPTPELVAALVGTARRHSGLLGKVISGGVLDVEAFLRAAQRPVCTANIPPSTFDDVDRRSTHVGSIDCVTFIGVAHGVGDGKFAPRRIITRGETAAFFARSLAAAGVDLQTPAEPAFDDIAGTTHEQVISQLAGVGIVAGVGDGQFDPSGPVSRGQMATFVVNAVELLLEEDLTSDRVWFDDVTGTTHERSIFVARDLGVTLGTAEPREFDPRNGMTREQMTSFLSRMLDAVGRQGVSVERLP